MIQIKRVPTLDGEIWGLFIKGTEVATALKLRSLEKLWNELKIEEINYYGKTIIGESR